MTDQTQANEDEEAARWNYWPAPPVSLNPLYAWPPRPLQVLQWYRGAWLFLSTTTVSFGLAVVMWLIWMPSLATTGTLTIGWIVKVWLSLLVPNVIVAGGLHIWLYGKSGQGKALKYDARDQARNNGTFTFRNQVLDNMFWTLVSGISIGTIYLCLWYWSAGAGVTPTFTFAENPLWFIVLFPLIPIWGSFHFYWVHRWLHWPPLYKLAHALHHRNINVGPWSGISMHPVEHVIYFSSFLLFLVIPAHPIHLLFHAYLYTLHPICSHSGFDALETSGKRRADLGDFFHQLHHRYFECNYGTVEMPWDRWFGTYHDGTAEATKRTRAHKAQMYTR